MSERPSSAGGDDAAAREADRLFASALAPLPPSVARLERLRARLAGASTPAPRRSARMAAVALALGLAGAAVAARQWPVQHAEPAPLPDPGARLPHLPSASHLVPAPPAPSDQPRLPAARPHPGARPSLRAPAPDGLDAETRLLTAALAGLEGHDGALALRHLDQYRRRFPAGVLRPEADRARVEALLALGRRGEALAVLETTALSPGQRLLRAELRADSDCARALSDFDALLTTTLPPALHERALRGRALCHAKRGDGIAARADFAAYLAAHPAGRFADEARAHLTR
jgi:hypothetical protein